jgi:glycosyltransferase involved in cell wall biosynthesis
VNGLLFEPGNPGDLAEKINLLTAGDDLKNTLGKKARDYVTANNLTWVATATRYQQIYEELLVRA